MTPMARRALHWRSDEDGGLTVLSLFMFMAMLILGGLAVDITNAARARTELQNAADIAGNMALYWREHHSADEARAKAVELAALNMPAARFGNVLAADDITFGTWDRATQTFIAAPTSKSAVRVQTRRITERSNALATFLLKLVAVSRIDLNAPSVWETYDKGCLREGFVAQGMVDLQSNNNYTDGFCIHSNTEVSINSNNNFELGTIVSVPSETALDLPRSGYKSNDGLREALQIGPHLLRVFDQLVDKNGNDGPLLTALKSGTDNNVPNWYVPSKRDASSRSVHPVPISGGNPKIGAANLEPGMINTITCSPGGKVTMQDVISNVILVTNCDVVFSNGSALENARLISTSTSTKAVTSPASMRIGRDDGCTTGGDAQIVTLGGVNFASGLSAFGAQILSMKNIEFSANADGIEGASFTALGEIHGTSNMSFGFCGTGNPHTIEVPYFRMVQ